jgi:hypothetical protein
MWLQREQRICRKGPVRCSVGGPLVLSATSFFAQLSLSTKGHTTQAWRALRLLLQGRHPESAIAAPKRDVQAHRPMPYMLSGHILAGRTVWPPQQAPIVLTPRTKRAISQISTQRTAPRRPEESGLHAPETGPALLDEWLPCFGQPNEGGWAVKLQAGASRRNPSWVEVQTTSPCRR